MRERARLAFEEHGHDRLDDFDSDNDDMRGAISAAWYRDGHML